MLEVSLRGSHYDVGFQHGEALRQVIQCAIRQRCRFFQKDRRPDRQVIEQRVKRLEAVCPELVEELRGIAEGARCAFEDVCIYNSLAPRPSCSNLVFPDSDRGPVLGHVNDHKPGGVFDTLFRAEYDAGRHLVYVGIAGLLGVDAGVNSDGLAFSHSAARPAGPRNDRAILNWNLITQALLQRCRDCQEAEAFLAEHEVAAGAENIIAVDRRGRAFVAEIQPTAVEFRRAENGPIYCTNRTLAPRIREMIDQDAYEKDAKEIDRLVNRENYFEKVLSDHRGRFSLELMKEVLRCRDEGVEICNPYSNWAAILVPARFEMLVADRFPCHHEFERFGGK